MDEDDVLGIWGYTEDESQGEIVDAEVVWECETCAGLEIGRDVTNEFGKYEIYQTESGWQAHDGHDLGGTATHPSYNPAYRSIPDFSYQLIEYRVDFTLTSK